MRLTFPLLSLLPLFSIPTLLHFADASVIPQTDSPAVRALGALGTAMASADSGKIQAAYFTNWGIYGANFQPTDINTAPLTHIVYSFADVQSDGTIVLTDSYADEQKHFPGDSWSESGNNLYGCLKQMYLIKLAHRNIKVLLSIGGWTYSQDGHFNFVTDQTARSTFVSSAVQLVKDYGFDGVDIDFEYPANTAQGQGFADLLTELRTSFDDLAMSNDDSVPYQITAAVAAGPANLAYLNVAQMDMALSYWDLMAYDYAGSWLDFTANSANVYDASLTNVSTDNALSFYLSNGATAGKINMGIPLYGHAFEQTDGKLGDPYNGIGPGTTQAGIYSYSDLPLSGATVYENSTSIASYSYDASKQELVSYDTPNIAKMKAQYALSKGLAGAMFWDLSTDKTGTADSLVTIVADAFGSLDQTQNHINYPDSKWDNIRNNMAGSTTSASTSPAAVSSSTPSFASSSTPIASSSTSSAAGSESSMTSLLTTPTSTDTSNASSPSSSSSCSVVQAWDSKMVYTAGSEVSYGNHLWTAKWWTQGDTPGGSAGAWADDGACPT